MDREEIVQIAPHTLDSGKERIVGLRADGKLMLWNWHQAEWFLYAHHDAARNQGFQVNTEAMGHKQAAAPRSAPVPSDSQAGVVDYRPGERRRIMP